MSVYEKLQKSYGENKILAVTEFPPMKVVSTGSVSLDFATGVGGIPVGRQVEVFGLPSVGKTSLSYYVIGEHLKAFPDRDAYYINIEGSFDRHWANTLSPYTNTDRFKVVHPEPGMESIDFMNEVIRSGEASIVVFDSIGAMMGEKESQPGNKIQAGGQSMMATHLAKLITVAAEQNETTALLVNQARDNFNAMSFGIHSPGGYALKHAAAFRIKLKRTKDNFKALMFGNEIEVGFRVAAELIKNKAAAPNGVAFWNFYNRRLNYLGGTKVELDPNGKIGIDREQEIMDLVLATGLVRRGGSWYYHDAFPEDAKGERKIKSADAVKDFVRSSPEAQDVLKRELIEFTQGGK